jgi:hypothetical protein
MSTQRSCPSWGNARITTRRGRHHFVESRLDNVHLLGQPVLGCESCGEEIVSIAHPTQLMKCIAEEGVLLKPAPLSGRMQLKGRKQGEI